MNSTTTSSPANRNLNEILSSESNIQNFVAKNKVAVFSIIGLVVAVVIAAGLFMTFSDKSKTAYNSKIYTFETTVLKNYLANPQAPQAAKTIESGIQSLHLEMGEYLGLLPVVIKSTDALMEHGNYPEARALLTIGEKISNDEYSDYFILSRQAVVFENMGEDKLAIETLEKMTSKSVKIFEGKTYLDLGRLYLKAGNKEKAKTNFQYVVDKAKDEAEFVKIAQLYLSKI